MKLETVNFSDEVVTGDRVKSFADVNGSEGGASGRLSVIEPICDEVREVGEVGSSAVLGTEAMLMGGEGDKRGDAVEQESLKDF